MILQERLRLVAAFDDRRCAGDTCGASALIGEERLRVRPCLLTSGLFWLQNRPSVLGGSVTAAVPSRSREQRLRALEQANEVRTARAKLKQQLASGRIELSQLLDDPPACVRTARVRDLLLAVPKIGTVRAGRILAQCGIAHSKTLGGLSDRQRGELLKLFRR